MMMMMTMPRGGGSGHWKVKPWKAEPPPPPPLLILLRCRQRSAGPQTKPAWRACVRARRRNQRRRRNTNANTQGGGGERNRGAGAQKTQQYPFCSMSSGNSTIPVLQHVFRRVGVQRLGAEHLPILSRRSRNPVAHPPTPTRPPLPYASRHPPSSGRRREHGEVAADAVHGGVAIQRAVFQPGAGAVAGEHDGAAERRASPGHRGAAAPSCANRPGAP